MSAQMAAQVDWSVAGLSLDQQRYLAARATTASDADAARLVGIHPITAMRWRKQSSEFARAYDEIGQIALDTALDTLRGALAEASATLVALLQATDYRGAADNSTRLAAAREILRVFGVAHDRSASVQVNQLAISVDLSPEERQAIRRALVGLETVEGTAEPVESE